MSQLFSDLRGLTVRNTFLEFEEQNRDDVFPETGFTRQASEPTKPFNRQVSEQTTTASGTTLEESAPDTEESYNLSYGMAMMANKMQMQQSIGGVPLQSRRGNGANTRPMAPDVVNSTLKAALHAATTTLPESMQAQMVSQSSMAMPRFCPNCGAESEPAHRFCPYCCYQLQAFVPPNNLAGAGPQGLPQQSVGPNVELGTTEQVQKTSAPDFLLYLRRFRYVEASPSDIQRAHALCMNMLQAGRAA